MTRLLHECGATIQEMNAVRKHLSRIKGGGLVRYSNGARSISLLISDVIGDPLDVIASGPTAVDPTTFADAVAVLQKYGLEPRSPANVLSHLRAGLAGQAPETLKVLPLDSSGRPLVENLIIANSEKALEAAGARADELGYVVFENPNVQGDTGQAAAVEARQAQELVSNREHHLWKLASTGRPLCLLSGGETTVVLPSEHGLGGRNQEYVLAFLQTLGIGGMKGITVLSGGTDGEDGPTDAAGAMGDADLLQQAKLRGLDSAAFLARHDAYHFFEPLGGLWKTGPTHTNVMDLRVVLIHPS
jgi:hydroxypyruvate reductase/glycerate 2-kinase